jgi:uncharacterized membrane protein
MTTTKTKIADRNKGARLAARLDRGELQMRRNFRPLFWVEVGLAAITGLLALITPIFPDWIEFVSGWDPDQHDGSVERMIVVGLFVVTIVMVAAAAIEWRRTPATASM